MSLIDVGCGFGGKIDSLTQVFVSWIWYICTIQFGATVE
jgi:hypothetical protein